MLACVYGLYEIFHWQQIWEFSSPQSVYPEKSLLNKNWLQQTECIFLIWYLTSHRMWQLCFFSILHKVMNNKPLMMTTMSSALDCWKKHIILFLVTLIPMIINLSVGKYPFAVYLNKISCCVEHLTIYTTRSNWTFRLTWHDNIVHYYLCSSSK